MQSFLDNVPLDALIRIARIVGVSGYRATDYDDCRYSRWNSLVWEVGIWSGCLWD